MTSTDAAGRSATADPARDTMDMRRLQRITERLPGR